MKDNIDILFNLNQYQELVNGINKNILRKTNVSGISGSQRVHFCHAVAKHTSKKLVYIASNQMQAKKILSDFTYFTGEKVLFFPAKEIMLYDIEAKSYDTLYKRIYVLKRILKGDWDVLVTSAEAYSQYLPNKDFFYGQFISIRNLDTINLEQLIQRLVTCGYERVPLIEGKGQFAVRGGIIDVYSVDAQNPYRIELFDDEVDSLREFDVLTQRSTNTLEELVIVPAREVLFDSDKKQELFNEILRDVESITTEIKDATLRKKIQGNFGEYINKLKESNHFAGIDKFIPYILKHPQSIIDYCNDAIIATDDSIRIEQRLQNNLLEHEEQCRMLLEKGQILSKSFEMFFDFCHFKGYEKGRTILSFNTIPSIDEMNISTEKAHKPNLKTENTLDNEWIIKGRSINPYAGHIDLLVQDVKRWIAEKNRIIVLVSNDLRAEKLKDILKEYDIITNENLCIEKGWLNGGFEYSDIKLIYMCDNDIVTQGIRQKKRPKKSGQKIQTFTDLKSGDYVVHQLHGIGTYVGVENLNVQGVKKDYLKIIYKDGGVLYIPTAQMDLIQKYIGAEGKEPKVNKLGSTDWAKTKSRVKESLKQLAESLIKIQAKRQEMKGYKFSSDTIWQKQFEEMFPYQETDDQLKCVEEIKSDMETDKSMDRLLCGDVGYGKTEVAMRAVFKAVMDGKQVAYLVPTTILASQQHQGFKERMKDFPVTIDMLSRFRTAAEQKNIISKVKAGNIDVLVGTHKILNKELKFKELGLLVIDEEQRFGVEHKEKLKAAYPGVDILTLTATPIPRTLHMSLVGIRDISTIEEPPEERYPIQTYVMEHNTDIIKDAVIRELGRNGQVFYLYNRVKGIQSKASQIQALIPEARVAYAHGQMSERQLEDIMQQFLDYEYDVLVCTTIIESGLDIPNVNTIVVENADRMGLAQLYQIRGRVGRSNRLAYAYLTFTREKVLSEIAEKRLQAIREFTEFGSGFKIAMRDLQIRGAGNLIGPEQHGHMESVGYDMYCRLLDEAVHELKGEKTKTLNKEVTIDINIDAYIPDSYISHEKEKIEMYKVIATVENDNDVSDVQDHIIDRYGDIPVQLSQLIRVAFIKNLAIQAGFTGIKHNEANMVVMEFGNEDILGLEMLSRLMHEFRGKVMFSAGKTPYLTYNGKNEAIVELLDNIKILLQYIIKLKAEK